MEYLVGQGVPGREIAILTPYRKQRAYLQRCIQKLAVADVIVGTTDEFQGTEASE